MSHYIIGTAGHVDHGKSTLIRALTGVDTDRLPEEKARGLSIDLGFAGLELPGGHTAGIVDVPGHQRFLKNMLAGVGGYDLVLLVVDAQEGVMPQTREHLEILDLLRIRAGVVALTKVDAVEEELLELVQQEVAEYLAGTFLARAPVVRVSAVTGEGLDRLLQELARALEAIPPRDPRAPFRLPVDRAFLKAGFGTVVTGSLWSGTLRLGARLEVLPAGIRGRVRGLQVHERPREEVVAGQRVAVNLSGVEPGSIRRGQVLAPPGLLSPTRYLDVHLEVLPGAPLPVSHRTRVRFYAGTAEVIGRVVLLEEKPIPPGGEGLAQLVLERPAVALRGDRFVLRDFTARYTLAGGEVLDPVAPRRRRAEREAVERLHRGGEDGAEGALLVALERAQGGTRTPGALARELQLPEPQVARLAEAMVEAGKLVRLGKHLALRSRVEEARTALVRVLRRLQDAAAWKLGWRREEVLRLVNFPHPCLAEEVLAEMLRSGEVVDRGGLLSTAGHTPRLTPAQRRAAEAVEAELERHGFSPPPWEDLPGRLGLEPELWKAVGSYLLETGRAVRVAPGMVFSEGVLAEGRRRLRELMEREGRMTPAQARDALGTTRKYIIPLLEHYDQVRFTRRAGDVRILA